MIKFDAIPSELKSCPYWVLWRPEERNGKVTKVPYQPNGSRASSTDPKTWSTYDVIKSAFNPGPDSWGGVGFVLQPPFVGIDFDHCISDDGQIDPQVAQIIERLDSYSEISPSGKGIHLIAKGNIPRGRKCPRFEIYQGGRYFTITGDWLEGTPQTVEDRSSEILSIYNEAFRHSALNKDKPTSEPCVSASTLCQSNTARKELLLRLERHGNIATVHGPKRNYSADLSQASQNRVYFDLLVEAVEFEYEKSMITLKVLTKESYLVRAINNRGIRRDADALQRFLIAARNFKSVLAEHVYSILPGENSLALVNEKVELFAAELQAKGISCRFEGIMNGNFARIAMRPGFFDIYASRRRSPSEPYAHNFADPDMQRHVEVLWHDFLTRS